MIGLALLGMLRGALARLAALPRPVVAGLAAVALLFAVAQWHKGRVAAAFAAGGRAQAGADRVAFEAANAAASAAQARLSAALAAQQKLVSKGIDDGLAARTADLDRRYTELRLRWAAYQAGAGDAGKGRTAPLPGAPATLDDAACAARGWVAFDLAAAAAHAADTALAKDDAWIAWAAAQAAAWPRTSGAGAPEPKD